MTYVRSLLLAFVCLAVASGTGVLVREVLTSAAAQPSVAWVFVGVSNYGVVTMHDFPRGEASCEKAREQVNKFMSQVGITPRTQCIEK